MCARRACKACDIPPLLTEGLYAWIKSPKMKSAGIESVWVVGVDEQLMGVVTGRAAVAEARHSMGRVLWNQFPP